MKTKEELNALKTEVEALNKKLAQLNEEELRQVSGGNSGSHWLDSGTPEEISQKAAYECNYLK